MKKVIFTLLAFTACISSLKAQDVQRDTLHTIIYRSYAETNGMNGLHVFIDASPLDTRYRVHGTVSVNHEVGSFLDVKKRIVEKVRKTYPLANGVIITFTNTNKVNGRAIEFDYRLPENHE